MSSDIKPHELTACTEALLEVVVPKDDLRIYGQVEGRIGESEQGRFRQLEEVQNHVKILSHTLSELRSTSSREALNWKPKGAHLDEMEKLQSQHFDLVKRINDDEARLRATQTEVEQLEREIAGLDHIDVESQEEMDKDAIAVGLFRKMGFVPCYLKQDGQEASSVFESLMVRSESKNRSTELEVNDEMMKARAITPYILANQLWLASE